MPEELDSAAMFAGFIILVILGASAALWIMHLQHSNRTFVREANVPVWPIGWINFGIFLCAMIASVVVTQLFAGELIYLMSPSDDALISDKIEVVETNSAPDLVNTTDTLEAEKPELTPWMAVLAVLLLQLPLLATFYALRRFYPSSFAGRLNSHVLTVWQALAQAIPQFIRYLPVIWIASFAWSGFLTVLQRQGIIDEFPPQELIKLFTAGGDPTAMTLLVICAVVLAPIVEEIIFRGGIYRFLKSQTTLLPAQILSGVFFAVMHGNLMSLLPLVVVGIFLARVYERSGNILVPMCFHACFNGFSLLMLYIMSQSSIPFD
jgi:membrane protease YdiL (CAAX protease family)